MKKKRIVLCILLTALATAGCESADLSEKEALQERTAESQQILLAADIVPVPEESVTSPETMERMEESASLLLPEAQGDEIQQNIKTQKTANIYNQPSAEASVLGSVSRGETVTLIGRTEDGLWYKLNYNGRVAYLSAEVIASETNQAGEPEVPPVSAEADIPVQESEEVPQEPEESPSESEEVPQEPEESPSESEEVSQEPEESEEAPQEPSESEELPQEPGESSSKSEQLPQEPGEPPSESEEAPQEPGESPLESEEAPQEPGEPPEESEEPPQKPEESPEESEEAPQEPETSP